jgi:hypothetical protein
MILFFTPEGMLFNQSWRRKADEKQGNLQFTRPLGHGQVKQKIDKPVELLLSP